VGGREGLKGGIMAEYITLMGAEDVRAAGRAIASAAADMRQAASSIDDSLHRHRVFFDEWLIRLEQALKGGETC
jgi:hypothetical protein